MAKKTIATTTAPEATTTSIVLPTLDFRRLRLKLVGTSPLICHNWDEKQKRLMLEKQMGKATAGKAHKDPVADYQSSFYLIERADPFESSRFGFPVIAFKSAAVDAQVAKVKAARQRRPQSDAPSIHPSV
jgi:hypothetical protein